MLQFSFWGLHNYVAEDPILLQFHAVITDFSLRIDEGCSIRDRTFQIARQPAQKARCYY